MTKIYLSGAITNEPNFEVIFELYERLYIAKYGAKVFNPAKHPKGLTRQAYMLLSFVEIGEADCIVMLPNWEKSEGAKIELMFAKYLDKLVIYER